MRIHAACLLAGCLAADPAAPEVLQADRLVAAAARKAVAMHRALEASRTMQQLPGGPSLQGETAEQQANHTA